MPTTSQGLRYPVSTAAPNVPQDIQNLAQDVDTSLVSGPTLTWVAPTLSTGWRQDTLGRPFAYVKYGGWVYFRGLINPAVGTTKTDPTPTIFTLPTGFRPLQEAFQPIFVSASPFVANVKITTAGVVNVVFFTGTHADGVAFGFDGVRFFVGS